MNDLLKNEYGIVKYVRLGDEIRLGHIDRDHSSLVRGKEAAVSAGFINYETDAGGQKVFTVLPRESMTLRLGPLVEDISLIAQQHGLVPKLTIEGL